MALGPIRAGTSHARSAFSPYLSVSLTERAVPDLPQIEADRAPAVSSATSVPTLPTDPLLEHRTPLPLAVAAPKSAGLQGAVPPQSPVTAPKSNNESAPNIANLPQTGVRLAVADEVGVRVHLLSYEGNQKPKDSEVIDGRTYIYFKAPGLKRTTQPREDARPHYPSEKPDYIHGAVILKLLIDEEGRLEQSIVVCSNPTFEKSAIASIENMRFTPAQNASGPVKSYMVVEFSYGRGFPCATVPDLSPSK